MRGERPTRKTVLQRRGLALQKEQSSVESTLRDRSAERKENAVRSEGCECPTSKKRGAHSRKLPNSGNGAGTKEEQVRKQQASTEADRIDRRASRGRMQVP